MSAPKLTKKQKKGLAFRERKGKKPRLDSVNEDLAVPQADPPVEEDKGSEAEDRHDRPVLLSEPPIKPTKKRKRAHDHGEKGGGDDDAVVPGETSTTKENINEQSHSGDDGTTARKTKKRKVGEETREMEAKTSAASAKARFILFVGTFPNRCHPISQLIAALGRKSKIHNIS